MDLRFLCTILKKDKVKPAFCSETLPSGKSEDCTTSSCGGSQSLLSASKQNSTSSAADAVERKCVATGTAPKAAPAIGKDKK
jgi:hypothetical protein